MFSALKVRTRPVTAEFDRRRPISRFPSRGERLFLVLVVSFTAQLLVQSPLPADQSTRPNVVLIMTDDQGWGDVHAHDNPHIQTPTLDRLRSEGASFDRFYVSPVCAPTRASLLTGRYHIRCGVHGVTRGMENMRSEEVTIAEVFQTQGYATGCFGKWHNGRHFPYHPNGQGFDEFIGFCAGHWNNYFSTSLEHNGESIETNGFITDVLTDYALEFIDQHRDEPFFCYVPYNAPHSPWQVPDKYWNKYADLNLPPETRCAYAMVENIDDNIARMLTKLDDLELSDNTIVLFLTDNGPNSNRYNGDMRGRKGSLHEGGVRVPLFVRWPERIKAGKAIAEIAMHIDLLPTLVELCGLKQPQTLPLDGRSLKPLLLSDETEWPDRILCNFRSWAGTATAMKGAARNQQYRAVLENPAKGWQLYDMIDDPSQEKDISKQHPQVVERMSAVYQQVIDDVQPTKLLPLPIPVGYPGRQVVELPGHEAHLFPKKGEGIRYNGDSGWANDWIDQWTDTNSYPYWNLEVVREGTYEVTVEYAGQSGAEVEVQAAEHSVASVIEESFVPNQIESPDRIERKEVDERTWGDFSIGNISLPKGKYPLEIRAKSKSGDEVIEIKSVRLRRVGDVRVRKNPN